MKIQCPTVTALLVKESGEWKMALDKMFPNLRIFGSPSPASSPIQSPSPSEDKEEGDDEHNGHED